VIAVSYYGTYMFNQEDTKTNKKVKWQYALEKRIKQLKKDLDTPVMATRRCRPRLRRPSLRHFQERYITTQIKILHI